MTKQERAELYRQYLVEQGYAPRIDEDGDVAFKYEGGSYWIMVDDTDETFFRVIFPNFWSIDSEDERVKVTYAALHATERTKVAKVFIVGNNTWSSIEMFCSPPDVFKPVFSRSLRALQTSVDNFREKMQA
jgi:hypothetical protein